jgi:patatin-like phospholipase/acyl hydrolase
MTAPAGTTPISIQAKLDKKPPYKLLACDGGGIRGIISIEILAKIEDELRASSGNGKVVLADYFDYVAGTSTGAIIAALVSLDFSVAKIRNFTWKAARKCLKRRLFWSAGFGNSGGSVWRKCLSVS